MSAFVRPVREGDVEQIHAIEELCCAIPWSRESILHDIRENPVSRWLVLDDGEGQVLAYAGMWLVIDEAHILNVAVRPQAQRQGNGRRVLGALIDLARESGMGLMTLEARRSNLAAHALYHACGFIDVGYRKRYYEDNREDALIMVCDRLPEADADFEEEETVYE